MLKTHLDDISTSLLHFILANSWSFLDHIYKSEVIVLVHGISGFCLGCGRVVYHDALGARGS